jgi:hypothetical protein
MRGHGDYIIAAALSASSKEEDESALFVAPCWHEGDSLAAIWIAPMKQASLRRLELGTRRLISQETDLSTGIEWTFTTRTHRTTPGVPLLLELMGEFARQARIAVWFARPGSRLGFE